MFAAAVVLFAAVTLAHAADKPEPLFPSNLYLVRGKAVEVDKKFSTFVIEHVYVGDQRLKGEKFTSVTSTGPFFANTYPIVTPIRRGEVGIWWITRPQEDKTLIAEPSIAWGPIRKGVPGFGGRRQDPAEWAASLEWAATVEQVYRAKDEERVKLLKKYALAGTKMTGSSAVYLLGKANPPDLAEFLDSLASKEKLDLAVEVALDTVLSRVDAKNWRNAPKRLRMLQRWFSGEIQDYHEYMAVVGQLHIALQRDEMDYQTFLRVMETGLANEKKMPPHFKGYLFGIIAPKATKDKRLVGDFLIDVIHASDDEDRIDRAAYALKVCRPLTTDQIRALETAREKAKSDKVKKILQDALRDCDKAPE